MDSILYMVSKQLASNETFLERICVSLVVLVTVLCVKVLFLAPVLLIVPPVVSTVLTQVSDSGLNLINPSKSIILNGFTFSTLDAKG